MENSQLNNIKQAFLNFKKSAIYEKSDIKNINHLLQSCLPQIQTLLLDKGQHENKENIIYLSLIFLVCNNASGMETLASVKHNELTISQNFTHIATKFFTHLNETTIHRSNSFSSLLTSPNEYESMSRENICLHNLNLILLENDKFKESVFNILDRSDSHFINQFMRTIQNTHHMKSLLLWMNSLSEYKQIYYVNSIVRDNNLSDMTQEVINVYKQKINQDYANQGTNSKWFILQSFFCKDEENFQKYKLLIDFVNKENFILNDYLLESYKRLDKNNINKSTEDIKNIIAEKNYIPNFSIEKHAIYCPLSDLIKFVITDSKFKISDLNSEFIRNIIKNTQENFFKADGFSIFIRDFIRSRSVSHSEKCNFVEALLKNKYFEPFISNMFAEDSSYMLKCMESNEYYLDYNDNKILKLFYYAFENSKEDLIIHIIDKNLSEKENKPGTLLFLWNAFFEDHVSNLGVYSKNKLRDILSDYQQSEKDIDLFRDIVKAKEDYARPVREEISFYNILLEKRMLHNTSQPTSKNNIIRL